jgi:hypothetical protein
MPRSGPGVLANGTRMLVAAVLLPLLLMAACSHAGQPAPPPAALGYCGSNLQVRPDVVLVVCNTDDITAVHLVWSDWGTQTATAQGSATVNLCAFTDCASGDYVSVPIEMTASKIVRCSKQARAYSVLRYTFPHGSPFRGASASATGGYFGQGRPLARR